MKISMLRNVLVLDSAVLILLGGCLIVAPRQVSAFFHFTDLPQAMSYLIGLWGCALLTLGAAYAVAATNPVRHRLWIQIGIARGALETVLGAAYVAMGAITFSQAGFGIISAAAITLAYIFFYPRRPRLATPVTEPTRAS
jgi:hypothetical protein